MFVQLGNVLLNTDHLVAVIKEPDRPIAHVTLVGTAVVKAIATEQECKSLYERLSSFAVGRSADCGETR